MSMEENEKRTISNQTHDAIYKERVNPCYDELQKMSKYLEEEITGQYTADQTIDAIKKFLEYGESSYDENREIGSEDKSHAGYFSGPGWAACCLRSHLQDLEIKNKK
jgi:hypothetical protein